MVYVSLFKIAPDSPAGDLPRLSWLICFTYVYLFYLFIIEATQETDDFQQCLTSRAVLSKRVAASHRWLSSPGAGLVKIVMCCKIYTCEDLVQRNECILSQFFVFTTC